MELGISFLDEPSAVHISFIGQGKLAMLVLQLCAHAK